MRWSELHIPTLREDPAGADAVSHRLLLRGGFIRQVMAGHYSLLPLAIRVRTKIIHIVREEMTAAGAQEFLMPTMQPAELWHKSGRWDAIGDEMFRLRDRRGADIALGMTHEEVFTEIAGELRSYRELPQTWYQFQTKFRDEPRPKSGLIRTREFTMKDAYSFDLDEAGLDRTFQRQHLAYQRIFARLGIPAIAVEASSGIMGGSDSVEFMCPTPAGEDVIVHCGCGYAANVEKATSRLEPIADSGATIEEFGTPHARTIEELARLHDMPAQRQIKTLVYVVCDPHRTARPTPTPASPPSAASTAPDASPASPPSADAQPGNASGDQLILVLMRGDHALVEQKLIDALGIADIRAAQPDEIRAALGAAPGSLGAVGVTHLPIVVDEALRGRRNMATGANRDGVHFKGVDVARDIPAGQWADLREVVAGEACPKCGSPLRSETTVEIGHIFKLGRKYTEALGVSVLGPGGNRVTPIMGCYGIGVERAMAAVVETHHDDAGIVWPASVAPFQVAIAQLGTDPGVEVAASTLYTSMRDKGIEVILDDRAERPGVKFSDIELVGIPWRVTISPRALAQGTLELTDRATGTTQHLPAAEIITAIR